MTSTTSITTAAQLLASSSALGRCELVRGELITMTPAGFKQGRIAMKLGGITQQFVDDRRLGIVAAGETGFWIARDPDTVRALDIAFVRADRMPVIEADGYFDGAPDLTVEVLSPDDRAQDVIDKVQDWLSAGCGAVWVVDPKTRTVTNYLPDQTSHVYRAGDTVPGEPVLPGLALSLTEVFG